MIVPVDSSFAYNSKRSLNCAGYNFILADRPFRLRTNH